MKTAILLLSLLAASLTRAGGVQAPLIEVEDGDTLLVELDGRPTRIQLAGIDAPEDKPNPKFNLDLKRTGLPAEALLALGRAATLHLRQLAPPGSSLVLEGDLTKKDRYGRIAVTVRAAKGQALNERMVADGYARALGPAYQALQKEARKNHRGLWGSHPEATGAWAAPLHPRPAPRPI